MHLIFKSLKFQNLKKIEILNKSALNSCMKRPFLHVIRSKARKQLDKTILRTWQLTSFRYTNMPLFRAQLCSWMCQNFALHPKNCYHRTYLCSIWAILRIPYFQNFRNPKATARSPVLGKDSEIRPWTQRPLFPFRCYSRSTEREGNTIRSNVMWSLER